MSFSLVSSLRASVAEVARAGERDEYFKAVLTQDILSLCARTLGNRVFLSKKPEIQFLTHMTYYLTTTYQAIQTLGEEYCDLDYLESTSQLPLTQSKRFLLCLGLSIPSYFLSRLTPHIRSFLIQQSSVNNNNNNILNNPSLQVRIREFISSYLEQNPQAIGQLLMWITKFHVALFFYSANYYHFSKRVLGVRSITKENNGAHSSAYKILGVLNMIPLIISLLKFSLNAIKQIRLNQQNDMNNSNLSTEEIERPVDWTEQVSKMGRVLKCSLCLSPRKYPTVTSCGHVFCWGCITEWCQAKAECPLCRQVISINTLIKCHQF